jgi:hypothetical protein
MLAAVSLIVTVVIVQQPSKFLLLPSSNTSTWPPFQYVSMDTSLDQQYENSYHISSRKYSHNWRYCHHANIYNRGFFFGFLWAYAWVYQFLILSSPNSTLPNLCKPAEKLFCVKELLQQHYSYGCIKSNEKHRWITDIVDSTTVKYLKALLLVVTKGNCENPVLGLVIRLRAWTVNLRTWILALSLHCTVNFTYTKLWQCH